MGGWKDSPEYGGPPWRWRDYIWAIGLFFVIVFGIALCSRQAEAQIDARPFYAYGVGETFSGIATVSDGDTLKIDNQRVRLWGIDAPERRQTCGSVPMGEYARTILQVYAEGQRVSCEVRMAPYRNRPNVLCRVNGTDLGGAMVDAGYAFDDERYSDGHYAQRESAARSQARGVWSMQCEEPWAYRARERSRNRAQ